MRLKHYFDILTQVSELEGRTVFSCGGAFFDEGDVIRRDVYLECYDEAYILLGKYIKALVKFDKVKYKIIDPSNFSLSVSLFGYSPQKGDFFSLMNDRYFYYSRDTGSGRCDVYVLDHETGKNITLPQEGSLTVTNEFIFMYRVGSVFCFDWNANLLWQYTIGNYPNRAKKEHINEYKNSVVFNAGAKSGEKCKLVRLECATGRVIWEREFDPAIDHALMIGDKIYIAVRNHMQILSPEDGSTIGTFTADLPDSETATTLWTDGKVLYVFASKSNAILCYSPEDFKHLKTYSLPAHPMLKHGNLPYTVKGVNYLGLIPGDRLLAGVEGGVLSWTSEDVLAAKDLEIEEKPSMTTIKVKEGKTAESYFVTVSSQNLDDVLRFGEIEAKAIAALRGKQTWDNPETINKKFSGQIKLLIDPAVGKENAQYLDVMSKRCTEFARLMDIKSGSGRKPVEVTWAFMDEV